MINTLPPGWFTVPTPLGSYNPDWAVLIDSDEGERLYFVVETKASLFADDLRGAESAKIECGKAHFNALKVGESPARDRAKLVTDNTGELRSISKRRPGNTSSAQCRDVHRNGSTSQTPPR